MPGSLVAGSPHHPVVASARVNAPEAPLLLQTLAELQPELGLPPNAWLLACARAALQPARSGSNGFELAANAELDLAAAAERVLTADTLAALRARAPAGRLVWVGDSGFGDFGADTRAVASWPTALAVAVVAGDAEQTFAALLARAHVRDDGGAVAGAVVVGSPGARSFVASCSQFLDASRPRDRTMQLDSPEVVLGCLAHAAIHSASAWMSRDTADNVAADAQASTAVSQKTPPGQTGVWSPGGAECILGTHAVVVAGYIGLTVVAAALFGLRLAQGRVRSDPSWRIVLCSLVLAALLFGVDTDVLRRNCVVDGFCSCEDFVSPAFDRPVRLNFPSQEFRDRWVVLAKASAASPALPACADLFAARLTGGCLAGDRVATVVEVFAEVPADQRAGFQYGPGPGPEHSSDPVAFGGTSGTCFATSLRLGPDVVMIFSGGVVLMGGLLVSHVLRPLLF